MALRSTCVWTTPLHGSHLRSSHASLCPLFTPSLLRPLNHTFHLLHLTVTLTLHPLPIPSLPSCLAPARLTTSVISLAERWADRSLPVPALPPIILQCSLPPLPHAPHNILDPFSLPPIRIFLHLILHVVPHQMHHFPTPLPLLPLPIFPLPLVNPSFPPHKSRILKWPQYRHLAPRVKYLYLKSLPLLKQTRLKKWTGRFWLSHWKPVSR